MSVMKRALSAYGQASIDLVVETASPHQLIVMLYEGAIKSVISAKFYTEQGMIAEKGTAISKAISIIDDGLRLALDRDVGGELVENLDQLYEYLSFKLLQANLNNDIDSLGQVLELLNQLKEAWQAINPALTASTKLEAELEPNSSAVNYGRA